MTYNCVQHLGNGFTEWVPVEWTLACLAAAAHRLLLQFLL